MSETSRRPESCIAGLTSVHLPFHSLHASSLLDDIVDELGGMLIPHLIFANSSLGEQLPQVRIQVVGVKARDTSDGKKKKKRFCQTTGANEFPCLVPKLSSSSAYLNPLGAPMSALDSLEAFFLFFLSFFPLLLKTKDVVGEVMER